MNKSTQHDAMTAQRYFDGALSPADAADFESHLAACAECRGRIDAWRTLGTTMRGAFDQPFPETAVARFVAVARDRQLQSRRRIAWGLVAAASFLLISSLSFVGYSQTAKSDEPAIIAQWEENVVSSPETDEEYLDLESRTLVAIHIQRHLTSERDND